MADKKITDLDPIGAVQPTTVLLVVDTPGTVPTNKKATASQVLASVAALAPLGSVQPSTPLLALDATGTPTQASVSQLATALAPAIPYPVASGGTGWNNLGAHQVLVGAGTSPLTGLLPGAVGQVLTSNGPSADPSFQAAAPIYTAGTWTPTLTGDAGGGSGQTYSSQQGSYIKIGKLVYVSFYLALTAKGTITGAVAIGGLPFPGATFGVHALVWYNTATAWVNVIGLTQAGTSYISVRGAPSAATNNNLQLLIADLAAAHTFIGSATYITP